MGRTTSHRSTVSAVFLGACLFLVQGPASAGLHDYRLLYGQGNATAIGTAELFIDILDPVYNTGYVWGGSAMSGGDGVSAISDASGASMTFQLDAEVGNLGAHLYSGSSAGLTPGYITRANAGGNTSARWGDRITLTGPFGTLVRLRATIELEASGTVYPFSVNSSPGFGPIGNSLSYYVALPVVGANTYSCLDRDGDCFVSQTFEFEVYSGTVHDLTASLDLTAYSAAVATTVPDPLPTQSNTSFDARARFYLDVLTPGFGYTTSSGIDLATPVPEPAAGASLLAGLLLLSGQARRRLRR